MPINKRLIKYNHSSRNGQSIEYIVITIPAIHDGELIPSPLMYFNGEDRQASAQLLWWIIKLYCSWWRIPKLPGTVVTVAVNMAFPTATLSGWKSALTLMGIMKRQWPTRWSC